MQVSDEQFHQELDYSYSSLYGQVLHTMIVEWWWFHFLAEGILDFPKPEDLPTRDAIRAKWDETKRYVHTYLATVTPTELARAVFGIDRLLGGSVRVAGAPVAAGRPRAAIELGLYLVPEDRKRQGLVLSMSAADNATLAILERLAQ